MEHLAARTNMIKQQFRPWGILTPDILALFEKVPREDFVPSRYRHLAYADTAIPLGHDQTMLTPKEEARILDVLAITPQERVLEIGTGSGYFTALLSHQAKQVDSVDVFEDFTTQAAKKFQQHNLHNIILDTADAASGYKKKTHYDVIILTGALPTLPKSFLTQLNSGGRLFAFLGKTPAMQASLIQKTGDTHFQTTVLFETVVTPLILSYAPAEFIF